MVSCDLDLHPLFHKFLLPFPSPRTIDDAMSDNGRAPSIRPLLLTTSFSVHPIVSLLLSHDRMPSNDAFHSRFLWPITGIHTHGNIETIAAYFCLQYTNSGYFCVGFS